MSLDGVYKQLYNDACAREEVHGGTFAVIRAYVNDVRADRVDPAEAIERIGHYLDVDAREIADLAKAADQRRRNSGSNSPSGGAA